MPAENLYKVKEIEGLKSGTEFAIAFEATRAREDFMAGYNNYSRSNNAVDAENSGLMVATKLAKLARQRWRRLRGITATDISHEVDAVEWHHTSSWYNKTNYYDPASLSFRGVRAALYLRVRQRREARAKKPRTVTNCSVVWLEWSGSRRHPHATVKQACGCTVIIPPTGETVTVTLADRVSFRKRLSTTGFVIRDENGKIL